MISTRIVQGRGNLDHVLNIRRDVFSQENKEADVTDFYDEFAFSAVLYDDDVPAGTGRLLFKEGRYFIDMVCVKQQFKGLSYEDLLVRMLIRKAVTIGAEKTYTEADENHMNIFESIGFKEVSRNKDKILMVKEGDVGGGCCGGCQ